VADLFAEFDTDGSGTLDKKEVTAKNQNLKFNIRKPIHFACV
jgi:hypothetical protein